MESTSADIHARVEAIFVDTFTDDDYEFSTALTSDDIDEWDSLNHIRLLTALEESFAIRFDIEEIENLTSVAAIVEAVFAHSG